MSLPIPPDISTEPIIRAFDWIFPPSPVSRQLLHVEPSAPTDQRPPLLFVHGASMGAWCWRQHWMPAAADRGWDCWAVSLRGHGRSSGQNRRHWMLRHYVHDVMQAITRLPAPPVLIGHSMGSLVVERVAERYPAATAVLMAPAGGTNGLGALANIATNHPLDALRGLLARSVPPRHEYLFSSTTSRRDTRAARARTSPPSPLNQYEMLLPDPPRALQCPAIVVGMERDNLVSIAAVERFARRYNTNPTIIPHAGHTPQLEPDHWEDALEIVLSAIESTLDRLPRTP